MDDRYRFTAVAAVLCAALGAATVVSAQGQSGNSAHQGFGPSTAQQAEDGYLGQHDSRFTLEDEDGNVEAYLYARKSLNLSRYLGQRVSVTVRPSETVGVGKPRLWVDQITAAGSGKRPGANTSYSTGSAQWPTALAQFTEPVVESTTIVYGEELNAVCGPPERFWVDAQYLLWWTRGMGIPPLVTTSPPGTLRDEAGVLGEPGTRILLGDQEILTQSRNGARLRSGFWFDRANLIGIEGDLFWLGDETISFLASCDGSGSPILARPFFNINPRNPFTLAFDPPAREDAQLVCYPDELGGSVGVGASTRLYGAGLALRANLACDPLGADGQGGYSRVDLLGGYRYLYLKDDLLITENLTALGIPDPVTFDIFDSFDTRNEFHGLDLGMVWRVGGQRWWFECLLRTAVGRSHQVVDIQGLTTIVDAGSSATYSGGLLAQGSNIGSHARNRLALVPEIGATLGYQVMPGWHLTAGYTLLHWSAVVRSGDQIDLDVNPDQLAPPIDPLAGAFRPAFAFEESAFWAHGLNVGIQGRF